MAKLTTGNEGKRIFAFAVPILFGNVFQQLFQITDSIIVGRFIGKDALAATGASFPIIFLLVSLVMGVTMGASTIIGQSFGAKNYDNIKKAISTVYIFLLITSVMLVGIGHLFSKEILRLTNLDEALIPDASLFMDIFMISFIFQSIFFGTTSILRGLGDSRTPLYFLIISTILNIILELLFVVVFEWGIAGAAWATVVATAITAFALIIYLNRTNEHAKLRFRELKWDKNSFMQSIRIGIPAGLQQSFVAFGMLALMSIVNSFGADVTAAYTIAGRVEAFATMPAMNFGMALSAFVSQNLGAKRIDRVYNGFQATLKMIMWITVIISLFNIFLGEYVLRLFTTDPNVIEIGHRYLIITGAFYVFFSSMQTTGAVMRGAGATIFPMFNTLLALWIIRIPLAYLFSHWFGVDGIWWAIPAAWGVGMLGSLIYYKSGRWKNKGIVKIGEEEMGEIL